LWGGLSARSRLPGGSFFALQPAAELPIGHFRHFYDPISHPINHIAFSLTAPEKILE
jgi:hypothetical protein